MSDAPQGPGWWQASDGKWYPPEQQPGGGQPTDYGQPAGYGQPMGGGGGGGGADLGSAFSYGWNKFVQNIGEWIVLWLIMFGIAIVFAILAFAVGVGAAATDVGFNAFGFVFSIISGAVSGVLLVVAAKAAVDVANGGKVDIGRAFKLTGNNIAAGAVFGLIYGVANAVGSIICLGWLFSALVFIFLGMLPVLSADEDKGADGLGEAVNLTTSNFATVGVLMLLGYLLAGCLCFLGAPIFVLAGVYLNRTIKGRPLAA